MYSRLLKSIQRNISVMSNKIQNRICNHEAMIKVLKRLLLYNLFRDIYIQLQKSQWQSMVQLNERQLKQSSKVLNHTYENMPFYSKVFYRQYLKLKDMQDFNNLHKLSFRIKKIIQNNLYDSRMQKHSIDRFDFGKIGQTTRINLGYYYNWLNMNFDVYAKT